MNDKNIVYISTNPTQAAVVKSFLQGHGIEAFLVDENVGRMNPLLGSAIGGIKVAVSSNNIKLARKLLKKCEGNTHFDRPVGDFSPFEYLGRSKDEGHRVLNFIASLIFLPLSLLTAKLFRSDEKIDAHKKSENSQKNPEVKMEKCLNCGSVSDKGDNFCDQCGSPLN